MGSRPVITSGLFCPRCQCELREHEPGPLWLRWFECPDCESAWHFMMGKLHSGRLRSPLLQDEPTNASRVRS